jgi:nucleolar protein 4
MSKEEGNGADGAKLEHVRGKSLQVALYGLPSNLNKKQLHKFLTHEMKLRKIDVELLTEEGLEAKYPWGRAMLVTASAKKDVQPIIKKFDGMTIKMLEKAIVDMETRIDPNGKSFVAQSENQFIKCRSVVDVDTANLDRRKQFCRVIVRNLSFQAQFEHIAKKLVKFGPIVDITLPVAAAKGGDKDKPSAGDVSESTDDVKRGGTVKHRGFAFVTFLCQKDAEAVIAQQAGAAPAVDGQGRKAAATSVQICNREVAIDFCDHKSGYERKKMLAALSSEAEADADKTLDSAESVADVKALCRENVAPDSDEEEEAAEDMDVDEQDDEQEDEDDDEEDDDEQEEEEEEEEDTRTLDDAQEGRTVFVRDLSLDITRAELWRAMHLLMPGSTIVSAFIVRDRITGLAKGSAFVKFGSAEEALRCADLHSTCTISDRKCRIDMALDRGGVEKVLEEQKNQVRDKRHVYLLSEGLIAEPEPEGGKRGKKGKKEDVTEAATGFRPDPQWAASMSLDDKDKRQRAQLEKKKKLVNPLFFVSPVRLSLRNLHKDLDDRGLKAMVLKAARAGMERKLVSQQDMELLLTASMVRVNSNPSSAHNNVVVPAIVVPPKTKGGKGVEGAPVLGRHQMDVKDVIVSVKVMCDADKLDKTTQAPTSKGYGFVEFRHHGHALAALRELNNNPMYSFNCVGAKELDPAKDGEGGGHALRRGSSRNRPIVEFAIENTRKVQILERRKENRIRAQQENAGDKDNDNEKAAPAAAATGGNKLKRKAGESVEVEEEGTTFIRPPTPANAKKSKKALAEEGAGAEGVPATKGVAGNKQLKRKERKLKRKQEKQEKRIKAQPTPPPVVATAAPKEDKKAISKMKAAVQTKEADVEVRGPSVEKQKQSNKARLKAKKN